MRVLILQCLFLIDRVWLHNYALISITQTSAMLRNAVAAAVDVLTIVTVSTLYTYVQSLGVYFYQYVKYIGNR